MKFINIKINEQRLFKKNVFLYAKSNKSKVLVGKGIYDINSDQNKILICNNTNTSATKRRKIFWVVENMQKGLNNKHNKETEKLNVDQILEKYYGPEKLKSLFEEMIKDINKLQVKKLCLLVKHNIKLVKGSSPVNL